MKKLISLLLAVLMMASLSVSAFAADITATGDNLKGTSPMYYTVTHENTYTDISAVKLEWSVPVLKYTTTDSRKWNTYTLKWDPLFKSAPEDDEVSFTLTNRSSYAVKANVSFTQDIAIAADTVTVTYGEQAPGDQTETINGNDPTIASIVGDNHALKVTQGTQTDEEFAKAKSDYLSANCTATIKGKVSVTDYSKLAESGKLGTYTVSIRNTKHKVTVWYVKDNAMISKTFTVQDGDLITVNDHSVTINGETITMPENFTLSPIGDKRFAGWKVGGNQYNGGTVLSDLTIMFDMENPAR